jgi:hypothetical protein
MKVIVCSNDQSTCVTDVVCKYNVINIMCVKMASHLCDRCDKDNVINIITRRDSLSRHTTPSRAKRQRPFRAAVGKDGGSK